jgi:hypothetical protein
VRHFLIYYGGGPHHGHNVAYLACAETPLAAIQECLREVAGVEITEAGAVCWRGGRPERWYPHALAYVEANYRPWHEWLIQEIPTSAWSQPIAEVMCGEDAGDVEYHVEQCRPLLRQEFPRSRARAFVWYLRDGVMVVFYQLTRKHDIRVLRRFVRRWEGREYLPWEGSYPELLDQLYLGPG